MYLRLEDVYIGILAGILQIPLNNIAQYCVDGDYRSVKEKTEIILRKGVQNTALIWASSGVEHFWKIIEQGTFGNSTYG